MLSLRRVQYRALREQMRVQKGRVDLFEARIAVGAVDRRAIFRVQREPMSADGDREIRRVGFAVRVDLVERALE